jgi:hypothetical protein
MFQEDPAQAQILVVFGGQTQAIHGQDIGRYFDLPRNAWYRPKIRLYSGK